MSDGSSHSEEALRVRQAELERENEALREASRRVDAGLARLAHELRGPLTPMLVVAQILERAPNDPQRVASLAATLKRQVDHLVALVERLEEAGTVGLAKQRDHAPPDLAPP